MLNPKYGEISSWRLKYKVGEVAEKAFPGRGRQMAHGLRGCPKETLGELLEMFRETAQMKEALSDKNRGGR